MTKGVTKALTFISGLDKSEHNHNDQGAYLYFSGLGKGEQNLNDPGSNQGAYLYFRSR